MDTLNQCAPANWNVAIRNGEPAGDLGKRPAVCSKKQEINVERFRSLTDCYSFRSPAVSRLLGPSQQS